MNWNIGKNILAIGILAFVFIGIPVLVVNGFGVADKFHLWNLTFQEIDGIGGFIAYAATLFVWYFIYRECPPH